MTGRHGLLLCWTTQVDLLCTTLRDSRRVTSELHCEAVGIVLRGEAAGGFPQAEVLIS